MQFSTLALAALSMGSAIAAPALGGLPVDLPVGDLPVGDLPIKDLPGLPAFDDALSSVGNVKTIVTEQVTTVTTLLKGTPAADAADKVQTSLLTVGQNVNGLLGPILALGNNAATPLSQGQLTSVPQLVEDCQAIVAGLQTIGKTVVGGLGQDGLNQVQPELQWVLSTAGPVVRPVVSFATTAVPGSGAVVEQVNSAVGELQEVANGLLAPVNGLLGGALGGLL